MVSVCLSVCPVLFCLSILSVCLIDLSVRVLGPCTDVVCACARRARRRGAMSHIVLRMHTVLSCLSVCLFCLFCLSVCLFVLRCARDVPLTVCVLGPPAVVH